MQNVKQRRSLDKMEWNQKIRSSQIKSIEPLVEIISLGVLELEQFNKITDF
jgi:hypothetical protein